MIKQNRGWIHDQTKIEVGSMIKQNRGWIHDQTKIEVGSMIKQKSRLDP